MVALLRERRIRRKPGPIRVGFLCQYIPAWSKVSALYEKMAEDSRFQPFLICIPSEQHMATEDFANNHTNDTYDYFLSNGYPAINALTEEGHWLDLKTLELGYVFYPRPYNRLLPACYQSQKVSRYSRICLIMYGIAFAEEDTKTALNRDFMSHVYAYFAETDYAQARNRKNNSLLHALGLQKSLTLGYPAFDELLKKKGEDSSSWAFSKNAFRVLWTPRWTTDKSLGGTNFFTFCDSLMEYARKNPDVDILHRPHPLALNHFLQIGAMTAQQVEEYQCLCRELPNVCLDPEKAYEATLWGASVLVSDISGMMPEFFVTGKPLVFCCGNMELTLTPHIQKMLEGCYIAETPEDLFQILQTLKNGEDPLWEKRQQLIRELFGDLNKNTADRILQTLLEDAK